MSEILITANKLAKHYGVQRGVFTANATLKAVADASFTVSAGRTLAIVGESGCGKSTLARLVTMIEPPTAGSLVILGKDVSSGDRHTVRQLRQSVQIVFQNPYGSLNPRQRIGPALEEPLAITTSLAASQRRDRARDMLEKVGLRPEHYNRYPHMFSGGQRQRIAIARALMPRPRILVLDEPVSALDISIRAQVLNLLADLKAEFGVTYIMISHDLSVVRHVADDLLIMYLGRIVEIGRSSDIFARPRHPYSKALMSATPVADPKAARSRSRIRLQGDLPSPITPPSGCPMHPRCPNANARCKTELPALLAAGPVAVACHAVEEGRI